uniref:Putative zinc finger, CCHC-type n=1 Tax=Tanacetum cinerariifolium TaxID=118510 RepID=A0A6L2KE05_TANCI|nr:putative zinc finger, CCHC-type [Tanacetum cinerariifolium]
MVNYHTEAKDIWDRVKLLIEGLEISFQERESKLDDEFDMFTPVPKETIHDYYFRFAQLNNDMHSIGMTMMPIQINTKFINHLQPELNKFVTDVKLAKDLHNTNFDHLHGYLRQHEAHANDVCLTRQ